MKNAKREVTQKEYKEVLLETIDVFDSFCRKNNLKYFLICGTLLGAVRHKGFIPWDDDVDIGMPKEDYEKFVKLFNNENHENIKFIDCFNNKKYYLPFGKLCNYKIDVKERINTKLHIGAYLDIFPLVYYKENLNSKKIYYKKGFIERLSGYKFMSSKNRTLFKKIILMFLHLIYPFSLNHIAKRQIKKAIKFTSNTKTTKYEDLFCLFSRYNYSYKEFSDPSWFSEIIELDFEGRKLFAPKDYDNYLKTSYGNYMELPPVEKRESNHTFIAYWND